MRFGVLGPLQIYSEDGVGSPVPVAQHRRLLAILLLRANQTVTFDEIANALWDGDPPAGHRPTVRNYVRLVRRTLGPELAGRLITRAPGYLIEVADDELDMWQFTRLCRRGREAMRAQAWSDAHDQLAAALALWRGPAFADVASRWIQDSEVFPLAELRLQACEWRIDVDLQLGRGAELVGELQLLVHQHPLREQFWAQLMLALYRAGRQGDSLAAYAQVRRLLQDELGVDPGPALCEAHQRVLAADAGPAGGPVDVAAEQPSTSTGKPAHLPFDIRGFSGREAELAELDAIAAEPTALVITAVSGPAGVGKTALAVHWAHRVRHRFPDGQLYLNLRGHAQAPPLPLIGALARFLPALGVPAEQVPDDPDQAADLYRSLLADRRVLIVLDDAASADQVRPLLPGTAGCMVLITSRDQLGGLIARDGARRLALGVLTTGDARHLLAGLLGAGRIEAEPGAVDELARLCGYLPLALRVAAANAMIHPQQPVSAYVERLRVGNRLAALEVGGDEQSGVRVAFDLSYRAQPAPARRLFRLLGLVPGRDVPAGAAAALAGSEPGPVERLLHLLAGAHLVEQPLPDRFALHDLLRLYAREQATAEDGDDGIRAATARLLGWYQQTVDAAVRLAYPEKLRLPAADPPEPATAGPVFGDHVQALAWLDAERANLIAAIEHAAEHGPRPAAWRLADALRGYFWLRMDAVDWRAAARAGMSAARADGDLQACAAAQISLADADWCQARYRPAIEQYQQALEFARRSGWHAAQATILGNLGGLTRETGQLTQAARHLQEALALAKQFGSTAGQANILGNLGQVQLDLGQPAEAADTLEQALDCHRKAGSRIGQTRTLSDLGRVRHALGDLDAALDHLQRSAAMTSETGDNPADQLHHIAAVHRDAGRPAEALRYAQESLTLARKSEYRRFEADALNVLGTVHLAVGDDRRALADHTAALEIAQAIEGGHPAAVAYLGLAAVHQHLGRPAEALGYARQALAAARAGGFLPLEAQISARIAAIERAAATAD